MRDPDLELWYDINRAEAAFFAEAERRADLDFDDDDEDEDDDRCPACERHNCSGRCCL